MKSLIGTYFKTKPLAIKKAQEKNRAWKENRYEVLEYNNGFMVVSGRQINEGNLKEKVYPQLPLDNVPEFAKMIII